MKVWLQLPESKGFGYVDENKKLLGYGILKKTSDGYNIAPLFADNYDIAQDLFEALLTSIP